MDRVDLETRFTYHQPVCDLTRDAHGAIRMWCAELASRINAVCPEGREKALAMTKLEEVMFWANGSIARSGTVLVPADSIDRYGLPKEDGE